MDYLSGFLLLGHLHCSGKPYCWSLKHMMTDLQLFGKSGESTKPSAVRSGVGIAPNGLECVCTGALCVGGILVTNHLTTTMVHSYSSETGVWRQWDGLDL